MNTLELQTSATFKNILVATDFSEASEHALEYAAAIAQSNEGQIFVVHALAPEPRIAVPLDPLPLSLDKGFTTATESLQRLGSRGILGRLPHEEILERGAPWDVVSKVIQRERIDLLVLGTHGRSGLSKLVLGSIAEELFRSAPCPVLTVGPIAKAAHPIRRVLYATDFGPSSLHALPYAIDFANKRGGELILLHLVPPMPVEYIGPYWYPTTDVTERENLDRETSLKKLRNLLPSNDGLECSVSYVAEVHLAYEGIVNIAQERDADLIVMGVRETGKNAPRFAAHMPWAIAHDVVRHSGCPVLTIRA